MWGVGIGYGPCGPSQVRRGSSSIEALPRRGARLDLARDAKRDSGYTYSIIPLKTNVCKFLIERPTTLDGASLAACARGGSAARSNQYYWYWQSDSGLVGECLARSAQRHAARPTGPRVASSAAYTSLTCFERTVQTPRRRHQYAISYDTRAPAHSARHRPIRTRPERVRDTKPSRSSLPRSAPR